MKTRVVLTLLLCMVTIIGVYGTKRRVSVTYIDSAFPGICQFPATLPGNCTPINTGVICKNDTRTFFQAGTCITTYYRF